jgi:hypothetical protein
MTDYQPTDADREAAKAICEQFFIVLGNDERTHKLIAAIIAEKMQPEREAADRLADAVENLDVPHADSCSVDRHGAQCTCGLRALDDSERAYREATK